MASTKGQVISCKAAVCWGPGEPLEIQDIEVAPPQAGEVRIKVLYTSLCRTDLTYRADKRKDGVFPRIFGHEASGIVESVGEGVTDLEEGDHVLPIFLGECKECHQCKKSRSNACVNAPCDLQRGVMLSDGRTRFSINGKPVYHFLGSTFSQYTVRESTYLVKVNRDAPLEEICVLGCGVTTGMASAQRAAKVEKNSTVVIFGLGTIGMAVAVGARMAGASRIIGVDTDPSKFEKAKDFGITECINPRDYDKDIHQVVVELTAGGVDYSFECVGQPKLMESAFLSCCQGSSICVISGVPGDVTTISLDPMAFLFGRTLTGALFGGLKPKSQLPELVEMVIQKKLELDGFITHRLPFTKINEAFKLLQEGKSLRCVMQLW